MTGNTIGVSSSTELMSALASATAGTTILLASGNYGALNLNSASQPWSNYAGEVTIKSADVAHPGTFSAVTLSGTKNLTFDSVKFDYTFGAGSQDYTPALEIKNNSSNIIVKNSIVDGDLAHNIATVDPGFILGPDLIGTPYWPAGGIQNSAYEGYATGAGVSIIGSNHITIENNDISKFARAVYSTNSDTVTILNNDIHDIRRGGIEFSNVDNMLIQGNYLHDWKTSPATGDHAVMIESWSAGTSSPSVNVTVTGNFLNTGTGDQLTSGEILLGSDAGVADNMKMQNLTVSNNVIYGNHFNGISFWSTIGANIFNNTLLQNKDSVAAGQDYTDPVYNPTIDAGAGTSNVRITNNIVTNAWNPPLTAPAVGSGVSGNIFVQNSNPNGANYVGNLFSDALAGSAATLADLKAVVGGTIDTTNVGSSLTQPNSSGLSDLGPAVNAPLPPPTVDPSTGQGTGSGSTGSQGTGSGSTGSQGTGSGSTGSQGTGSGSTGSQGTGSGSTGSQGTGSGSTGSQGTGSGSTGSQGTGSGSTGSQGTGSGSTGSQGSQGHHKAAHHSHGHNSHWHNQQVSSSQASSSQACSLAKMRSTLRPIHIWLNQ